MLEGYPKLVGGRRLVSVAGVIFALCWPLALAFFEPKQNLSNIAQDVSVVVVEWVAVAIIFAVVVFGEQLPFFRTVGLQPPKRVDWIIVGFIGVVWVLLCVAFALMHTNMAARGTILAQAVAVPFALRALMVFTAGVCEEILFRGYAIERLSALTGTPWIGALVATVLFTLGHLPRYGVSSGLFGVFVIGSILSLVYVWRRNLAGCIAIHWLIDGISLLIVPALGTLARD